MSDITSAITNITKEVGSVSKGVSDTVKSETTKTFSTGCDSNVTIGEVGAKIKELSTNVKSSLSSGIASSISSIKSQVETGVGDLKKKVDSNLLGDIPKVDVKLQESFKGALDSIQKGDITGGIAVLQNLNTQFPTANVAGLLQKSAGLIPGAEIPPNATELIQADLIKAQGDISAAIPKIKNVITGGIGSATSALGTANSKISEALNLTNNASDLTNEFKTVLTKPGAGSINDLKNIAGNLTSTLTAAGSKISEVGGSLNLNQNTSIGGLLDSAKGFADKLLPGLNLGEQKIPPFNICQAVPNLQLQNGSSEPVEEAKPPPAPVVDAVKPEPPAPTPKPKFPVGADPFQTVTNIVSKQQFLEAIQELIDAKTRQKLYETQQNKFVLWGLKAISDQTDFYKEKSDQIERDFQKRTETKFDDAARLNSDLRAIKQTGEYRSYQKLYNLCLAYKKSISDLLIGSKDVESFEAYYSSNTGPTSGGGIKNAFIEAKASLDYQYSAANPDWARDFGNK